MLGLLHSNLALFVLHIPREAQDRREAGKVTLEEKLYNHFPVSDLILFALQGEKVLSQR